MFRQTTYVQHQFNNITCIFLQAVLASPVLKFWSGLTGNAMSLQLFIVQGYTCRETNSLHSCKISASQYLDNCSTLFALGLHPSPRSNCAKLPSISCRMGWIWRASSPVSSLQPPCWILQILLFKILHILSIYIFFTFGNTYPFLYIIHPLRK